MEDILGFLGISDHDMENELFVREYENELRFATRREKWADEAICCPTQGVKRAERSTLLPTLSIRPPNCSRAQNGYVGPKVGRKLHVFVLSDRLLAGGNRVHAASDRNAGTY